MDSWFGMAEFDEILCVQVPGGFMVCTPDSLRCKRRFPHVDCIEFKREDHV